MYLIKRKLLHCAMFYVSSNLIDEKCVPYKPADTFAFSEAHGSQSLPLRKSKKGERHFPFVTYFGKRCFLIRRKFIPGTCVSTNLASFSLGEGEQGIKKCNLFKRSLHPGVASTDNRLALEDAQQCGTV